MRSCFRRRASRASGSLVLFDAPYHNSEGPTSPAATTPRRARAKGERKRSAQHQAPIFDAISQVARTRTVSFQTPGHTGGQGIAPELEAIIGPEYFRMDVSVCASIDSLSHPHTFIRDAERLLAEAYGAKQSFFIVNGSTTGNLVMMMSALREGDHIILPRYVHRSLLHALALTRATPIWIANNVDPVYHIPYPLTPSQVAAALEAHPYAKAVLVNSPTYNGLCSDVTAIAEIVHRAHKLLLVDEAWGAHLAFHPQFPASAAGCADLCIQSLHKTLPVTNQGAVLHCNSSRIAPEYLVNVLTMFQTTSPSYVLLSVMDVARRQMALGGTSILDQVLEIAEYAQRRIADVDGLSCLTEADLPADIRLDPVKFTIRLDPRRFAVTGYALEHLLCDRYGIQIEMSDPQAILIMLKPGIRKHDIDYLLLALRQLQREFGAPGTQTLATVEHRYHWETVLSPFQAFNCAYRAVPLAESVGEICWESIYAYPPGTPVVMPGECITQEIVSYLQDLMRMGATVKGVSEHGEALVCDSPLVLSSVHQQQHRHQRRKTSC